MTMRELCGLGYVGLEASDLGAWERFATAFLGLELAEKAEDGALQFRLDEYAQRITVVRGSGDDIAFVGWEVVDEDGLDRCIARLVAAGLTVREGSVDLVERRRVRRAVIFHDPEGLRHELFCGPLLLPHAPFRSPRGLGDFVTGDQGLGHIVLFQPKVERNVALFRDVLGFRVSDYIDAQTPGGAFNLTFLRCSPRHHALALAPPVAGRPPKRLAHLMLQAASIDDVGATLALAQQLDVPVAATLGRHVNDRMLSFYATTPSGWEVEFGCDGLRVDDDDWHVRRFDRTSVWGHVRGTPPPLDQRSIMVRKSASLTGFER